MLFSFTCTTVILRTLRIICVIKTLTGSSSASRSAQLSHYHSSIFTGMVRKIRYLLCRLTQSSCSKFCISPMEDLDKASRASKSKLSHSEKEIQEPRYLKCLTKVMKPS